MSTTAQQDARTTGKQFLGWFDRLTGPALVGLAIAVLLPACDCHPPRHKPWRHAPEPVIEPSAALRQSEAVAAEANRIGALRRREHTLRVHMDAQLRHLNPLVSPSLWTTRIVADTVFETLVRYQPPPGGSGSGPGEYAPGLASSWQISSGGREIRIDLEADATFHDGRRVSSVDVQFSLDAARNPRVKADELRLQLADVAGIDLLTSRSLRVRLNRPNGYVLRALASVPILPAHLYESSLRGLAGKVVVGSGPYQYVSSKDGVIRLTRFPDYWGPAPAIDNLEFVYEPDAARVLTAAKRGELDVIPAMIAAHYPEQASAPGLASDFRALRLRPTVLRYLVVNSRTPPFDDVSVRLAVALIIDRKTMIKTLHDGLARPVAGPVWPGGLGDGAAPAAPEHDPAEAARLLDLAGWRDSDGDGRRERAGERLHVAMLTLEKADAEREIIVKALRRAGFTVEQRRGNAAVLRNRMRAGEFDLAMLELRGEVDQDLAPLLESGGALNYGGFSDRRVDQGLMALRGAWEPASRAPLMADLAAAVAAAAPLVPILALDPYGLIHKRVGGAVVWNGWISLRDLSLAQGVE